MDHLERGRDSTRVLLSARCIIRGKDQDSAESLTAALKGVGDCFADSLVEVAEVVVAALIDGAVN
jgi:hypothetical protein